MKLVFSVIGTYQSGLLTSKKQKPQIDIDRFDWVKWELDNRNKKASLTVMSFFMVDCPNNSSNAEKPSYL